MVLVRAVGVFDVGWTGNGDADGEAEIDLDTFLPPTFSSRAATLFFSGFRG